MPSIMLPNFQGAESAEMLKSLGESLAESERWQGYCEGLEGWTRASTAILLENQFQFMNNSFNETT